MDVAVKLMAEFEYAWQFWFIAQNTTQENAPNVGLLDEYREAWPAPRRGDNKTVVTPQREWICNWAQTGDSWPAKAGKEKRKKKLN